MIAHRRRRRRPRAHEHERARAAREGRARGGQARARREADGDLARARRPSSLELSRRSPGLLVCAPHILLSPTFRAVHAAVRSGEVGRLLSARARYGWAGPDWNEWFYQPGGGSLFDLGVYNVTSLCALFGPARRVTAMVGVAIPERVVNGRVDPGRGRRQRPGAARLRRGPLRLGDDRVHDAEVPLARDRALRQRGHDPAARRRLGARGLGAVAERGGVVARLPGVATRTGSGPRGCATSSTASRPDGRRSRAPSTPSTRSRSCSPRRRRAETASPREIESDFPDPVYGAELARCRGRALRPRPPEPRWAISRPRGRPSTRRPCSVPTRSSATRGATRRPGFVEDWIYVSSQLIHAIVFGMPPGGKFTHSESFRTIFAADELLYVLQGTLVLANPETGEIVRAEPGESVFFRRDTWHHGFSYGDEPLRVLEFFAPPPATGTSGAYAQTQAVSRGQHLRRRRRARPPRRRRRRRATRLVHACCGAADAVLRLDLGVLVGLLVSTEHLTVGHGDRARRASAASSKSHDGRGAPLRDARRAARGGRRRRGDARTRRRLPDPAGTPHSYAAPRRQRRRGDLRRRADVHPAGLRICSPRAASPSPRIVGIATVRCRFRSDLAAMPPARIELAHAVSCSRAGSSGCTVVTRSLRLAQPTPAERPSLAPTSRNISEL